MRILAIERELPKASAVTIEEILRVEAACVWDLQKRGIIRDIWFTTAGNHAVIMLECANATEARQHLAVLPLVNAGVIGFTVHELRSYDGFELLFAHRLSPEQDKSTRERAKKTRRSRKARRSG
jgi:muconolactone delta-isomerase